MRKKVIYVGNMNTGEFHSIKRQKPACNVNKILDENTVYYRTGREAIAAGKDACGHCSVYWKSRDNK